MKKWLQEFLKWFRPEPDAAHKEPFTLPAQASPPKSVSAAPSPATKERTMPAGPSVPISTAPGTVPAAEPSRVARRRPRTMKVHVGLDFGTSMSKIMVNPGGAGIQPLDVHDGSPGTPGFMVPTLIGAASGGRLLVGAEAQAHVEHDPTAFPLARFKMLVAGLVHSPFLDSRSWTTYQTRAARLFGSADIVHPETAAAVFIADTMRRVRYALEQRRLADEIDVVFNTCVPIDQAEHQGVKAAFDRVAAVAQRLYESFPIDIAPSMDWISEAGTLREAVRVEQGDATRLFVFPEAVASFATYKDSLSVREGNHALIDIGAGTTDVTILYVAKTNRHAPGTTWWAARSVPMGMGMIEDAVQDAMGSATVDQVTLHSALRSGKLDSLISQGLHRIWEETKFAWADAYDRYPGPERWSADFLRIFLAGGGADVPPARRVFSQTWLRRKEGERYPVEILPSPEDFAGLQGLPFHRLSVAYGLCRPGPALDAGVLPSLAPRIARVPASYRVEDPFDGPT